MSLREAAMIVHLDFSFWTGNRLDKQASDEANAMFGAVKNASRVTKYLIDPDNLKQCRASKSAISALFKQYTVPWLYDGTGLLPSAKFQEFRTKLDDLIVLHNAYVDLFCQMYGEYKRNRKKDLGKLYKESEYPSESKIRCQFAVYVRFEPVPNSSDFRCDIDDEEVKRIQQDIEDSIKNGLKKTTDNCWERLYSAVKHFADILSNEKSRVFESTVDKIQDVCNMLSALNLANDPHLEKLRKEVASKLAVKSVDDLREDMSFRAVKATEAKDVLTKIEKFFDNGDNDNG